MKISPEQAIELLKRRSDIPRDSTSMLYRIEQIIREYACLDMHPAGFVCVGACDHDSSHEDLEGGVWW